MSDTQSPEPTPLTEVHAEIAALLQRHGVSGMILLTRADGGHAGYHFDPERLCLAVRGRQFIVDSSQTERFHATACAVAALCQMTEGSLEDLQNILRMLSNIRGFVARVAKQGP